MKRSQWIAVLVLALMVGGITFATVYLGGGNRPVAAETPAQPLASLTFAEKRYPVEGERAPVCEINRVGYQDFWFHNESGHDVTIGLNSKSCQCSEVELSIVSEEQKARLLADASARMLQRAACRLVDLPTLAATFEPARVFPDMPANEATTTPLTAEDSQVVRAGAIGRVRLSWRGDKPAPKFLSADLWMNQRNGGVNALLEVRALIAEPIVATKDVAAGDFRIGELREGKKTWIVCQSLTRPSFRLKAQPIFESGKAESDPITVGEPIPLTRADIQFLEGARKDVPMPRILSGYRIPVTVRAKAKDGTPLEWGHFVRTVELSSDDEGIEPVRVKVTGVVYGGVTVGEKEGGVITLGPFLRSRGKRGTIVLHSDEKIDLEVDWPRIPGYLKKVTFPSQPEVTKEGHRMWKLEVTIPPNAARGVFPRADDPDYRDSAIYVKTKNETPPRDPRSSDRHGERRLRVFGARAAQAAGAPARMRGPMRYRSRTEEGRS